MRNPKFFDENTRKLSAGAAAGSFVAITQLATRDVIAQPQLIAIGCFTIALPIFAAVAASPSLRKMKMSISCEALVHTTVCMAGLIFLFGIASLLWGFGWYFGVIFGVLALACMFFLAVFESTT